MPDASRWLVRAALVHLCAGFAAGALVLCANAYLLPASLTLLHPVHAELVLVGFMLQLALGVATWILPREADASRAWPWRFAWAACGLLNAGVVVASLGHLARAAPLVAVGRAGQVAAAAAFALHAWARVRGVRGSA